MDTIPAETALRRFRLAAYRTLGHRKDTLFELMEAALVAPGPANLVHLSLAAPFRRRWPSACDALADGQVRPADCRALIRAQLPAPEPPARPLWAGDGTTRPGPTATSPARASPRTA